MFTIKCLKFLTSLLLIIFSLTFIRYQNIAIKYLFTRLIIFFTHLYQVQISRICFLDNYKKYRMYVLQGNH